VDPRNLRINRYGWIAYAIALAIIVLDQVSKHVILDMFFRHCGPRVLETALRDPGCRLPFTPISEFTMVWNPGMSFGFLNSAGSVGRWFLTFFALAVAAGLAWWTRHTDRLLFAIASGLLIGGSIGNVFDRFHYGSVVDFLDFSRIGFHYIFNVADSGVTIGATLLLVEAFWPSLKSGLPVWRDRLNAMLASLRQRGG
jgi:signal peptidase II